MTAQGLMKAATGARDAMLTTLADYVNLETPSDRPDLLARALPVIETMIRQVAGPHQVVGRSTSDDHGPHVVLDLASPEPGVDAWVTALCHYDTVWPAGTVAAWPFRISADTASGPGVFDMKAGLVQLLYAIRLLDGLGMSRPNVRLVLNGDEEIGSPSSRFLIEKTVRDTAGPVLVFEASAGEHGALKTRRKGVGIFSVTALGVEAHAGLDPSKGVSANDEIARHVLALHALADPAAGTTVNVGLLEGGTRTNVFAGRARADVDVRVATVAEQERIDAGLRALSPHDPRAAVEVAGEWNRPVMERTPGGAALFELTRDAGAELGLRIDEVSVGGASDGNFAVALGAPVLDGFGAVGDGARPPRTHQHPRDGGTDGARGRRAPPPQHVARPPFGRLSRLRRVPLGGPGPCGGPVPPA